MRVAFGGVVGFDYAVYVPLIERRGWDMDVALTLLGTLEQQACALIGARSEAG